MTSGKTKVALAALLFTLIFSTSLSAAISIVKVDDPNIPASDTVYKGTLVITSPDGRITILEPSDPLPVIEQGSVLEIFDGYFTVETGEGDNLTVSVLGNEFTVSDGTSVTIVANQTEGKIIVRKGFASYKDTAGQISMINAPKEFPVALGESLAPLPTADGGGEGFGIGTETVPDSRNIESSPSA